MLCVCAPAYGTFPLINVENINQKMDGIIQQDMFSEFSAI